MSKFWVVTMAAAPRALFCEVEVDVAIAENQRLFQTAAAEFKTIQRRAKYVFVHRHPTLFLPARSRHRMPKIVANENSERNNPEHEQRERRKVQFCHDSKLC
jgi:hypothetical protein